MFMRALMVSVAILLFLLIGMNCGNPAAAESTVDTLYINKDTLYIHSSDTIYRVNTVYSKDTVYVETLLINRSVYIDTAGIEYSKLLAYKIRLGDLPFMTDSVRTVYKVRFWWSVGTNGRYHFDTLDLWPPYSHGYMADGTVIDTIDSASITYGYYTLNTAVPFDSSWIMLFDDDAGVGFQDLSNRSSGQMKIETVSSPDESSIRFYYTVRPWVNADPANNSTPFQIILISPLR